MNWDHPKEGENSLLILWKAWRHPVKPITNWQFVRGVFTRFPQWILGPFEYLYWISVTAFGKENWIAPHNLWREVCHHGFGIVAGFSLSFGTDTAGSTALVGLWSFMNELSDNKERKSKFDMKDGFDVLAWGSGSFVGAYFSC